VNVSSSPKIAEAASQPRSCKGETLPSTATATFTLTDEMEALVNSMILLDQRRFPPSKNGGEQQGCPGKMARIRLSRDIWNGRYLPGERLHLRKIAEDYDLDPSLARCVLSDLDALGIVTLEEPDSAIVKPSDPKEMHKAYEILAALEEIAGRAAAGLLKGKTDELRRQQEIMRAAVRDHDLDAYAEHHAIFHRSILEVPGNEVLLRVWDALSFDLRMRATVGKIAANLPEIVESLQPIIDALQRGQGREAGLLLRSHVEGFLHLLKKADSYPPLFRRDLEIARDVQKTFIPQQAPSIPGLSCEAFYRPAHSIGGDYYDFFPLEDGRWGIAVGDVSGNGIGAALIMASLQASIRAQALHPHSDPAALISHVNRLMHESSPVQFYASLFYAEYEPATRRLTYVNAGQNPPFVVRCREGRSQVWQLQPGASPVGMFPDSSYRSVAFQLEPEDILVACTDGIIETESDNGELWGQQGLEDLFSACARRTALQVVQSIVRKVSVYGMGRAPKDDMTLVVLQVQATNFTERETGTAGWPSTGARIA
jgi:DNA-binding GntR family transcriptional regulator